MASVWPRVSATFSCGKQTAHRPIEGLTRSGAVLAHDPGRREQIGVGERALARQRMPGRAEDDELVVAPRGGLELRVVDLALDQADVELEVGDLARDLFRVGHLEREGQRSGARA